MNWQEVCDHPLLKNLPFKLETDRWGHIVMSPATNKHSWLQGEILSLLRQALPAGRVLPECSIQTSEGVKVADAVWGSAEFFARHGFANPYPEAPEIVVEVLSPSNSLAEMEEKRALYFACGAREFWICEEDGAMRCHDRHGKLERSRLAPEFPERVELPL
jgi:Uma2 family endonuclease